MTTTLLDRKLYRDLLAIRGRVVLVVLVIASGVGILFGVQTALGNLLSTLDTRLTSMRFADLEIQLQPQDARRLPDLSALDGVAVVQERLVLPGRIDLGDEGPLQALAILQDRSDAPLNRLDLVAGRGFRPGRAEAIIDWALADYHGFAVGDPLPVDLGFQSLDLDIVGIAVSPEFLVTSANPDYVIPEPGSLGVLWTDALAVDLASDFRPVNSLLVEFVPGAAPERVTEKLVEALADRPIEKVTPWEESFSYKAVRMDVAAFGVYSPAIIVTLYVLSLVMGAITFRRFVVEKQREFGVLTALGYRRGAVVVTLAKAGILLGLGGGIVGLFLGAGLGWAFAETYANAMHLRDVIHAFAPWNALAALALAVASGCVALLGAALPLNRLSPRQLLHGRQPNVVGSVGGRLRRLPVSLRYGLRSLARDRVLSATSIVAMGGAVGVAMSYGLAMSSTFGTVESSFHQERWRFAVDFEEPLSIETGKDRLDVPGVELAEPYYRTAADVRSDRGHLMGVLVGVPISSRLHVLQPARGRSISGPGEAVVSADIARNLEVELGHRIEVRKGSQAERMTVVGITNDIFLRTTTVPIETAQALAQAANRANGYYVDGDARLGGLLAEVEGAVRVTDKARLVEHFRQQISDMMGIVYITIIFSIAVSLLFVTTLVYLAIEEKHGEYAVLRSLGYTGRQLRLMVLTGVGVQVLLACALAVPVALGLVELLNGRMGEAWFAVDTHAQAADFLLPMLAALLVAPTVGLFGARYVMRFNIARHLRGRDA